MKTTTLPLPETLAPASTHRDDTVEAYQKSIERVILHMKEHLEEPLNLEQLARIAAMSKFHLVRIFDELTGTTPRHFLACLRVQRAKELLLKPDSSITEVCMTVGYSSLGTFSQTFSSLVGVSPQEFKAMPKRLTVKQFAATVWRYLAQPRKVKGQKLEGRVENPDGPGGFIFVGTFTEGVPQGTPFSGTVMVKPGKFCIERPTIPEFHLLAALIPYTANFGAMMASLPVELVASMRMQSLADNKPARPSLRLRPLRVTDPPIVLALPALQMRVTGQ